MESTISEHIVQFAIGSLSEELPASGLQVLRLSLVDWIAVGLSGVNEPVARITRDLVSGEGGVEESYAIGLTRRIPARAAALVNGSTSHALDYDDTHFASLGHPSVAVMPAVMALANKTGAGNAQLQAAALIGMEVAVRIGMWLGRDHYRKGFHITSTAGTFGAAMAASRLLGLTAEQASHALGIAASRAGGVKAQFGTMGKPMHAGFAASNGVEAALLASYGFIAAPGALEQSQGFADSHHGQFNNTAFDSLGERFILEEVSYKFHACCHGTHAALEACIALRKMPGVEPRSISSIEICVHPQYLDICNIAEPKTALQSKFSYHMVAALAMHEYNTARLDTFSDRICSSPDFLDLQGKVRVKTNPDMTETQSEVVVKTRNGDEFSQSHDLLDPLPPAERERLVREKVASLVGQQHASELWQQVAMGNVSPTQWMQDYLAQI